MAALRAKYDATTRLLAAQCDTIERLHAEVDALRRARPGMPTDDEAPGDGKTTLCLGAPYASGCSPSVADDAGSDAYEAKYRRAKRLAKMQARASVLPTRAPSRPRPSRSSRPRRDRPPPPRSAALKIRRRRVFPVPRSTRASRSNLTHGTLPRSLTRLERAGGRGRPPPRAAPAPRGDSEARAAAERPSQRRATPRLRSREDYAAALGASESEKADAIAERDEATRLKALAISELERSRACEAAAELSAARNAAETGSLRADSADLAARPRRRRGRRRVAPRGGRAPRGAPRAMTRRAEAAESSVASERDARGRGRARGE